MKYTSVVRHCLFFLKNEKQFLYKLHEPISHFQIDHQVVWWHKLQTVPKHSHLSYCKALFLSLDLLTTMFKIVGRIAQSVQRLATGWTVRGSNPGGVEIFRTCPDWPCGPPSLLYNEYRVFPGVKNGRGVTLNLHPLLVPWS